jgi:HK97 family phage major capsid protein
MPFAPTITDNTGLPEVRDHLQAAAQYAIELRRRPADQRGENYSEDLRSALDFINQFDAIERALAAGQRAADDQRIAAIEQQMRAGARSFGVDSPEDMLRARRSWGEQVVTAEGFEDWAGTRNGPYTAEVRNLISEYPIADGGTGSSTWLPVTTPVLHAASMQRRRMFVRDLVAPGTTGLSGVPYIQEVDAVALEGGASAVSEGSAKPEVDMQWVPADAPVRKIAAWIPATDEIMADAPTLRSYIDARLEYMLLIREEAMEINGTGTAPQLKGILAYADKQSQSAVSGDFPATVAAAIGKVENVDGDADGLVCNPVTYWTAVAKRHSEQFDNGFGGNAPATVSGITWGLASVRTRAVAAAQGIVGAFRFGAQVFDRQGVTIKVADQHSDDFIKNMIVIRAEKRLAFAVWRPNLFVDTTLPTS